MAFRTDSMVRGESQELTRGEARGLVNIRTTLAVEMIRAGWLPGEIENRLVTLSSLVLEGQPSRDGQLQDTPHTV